MLGWLVRLGAERPFARAAFWLEELTGAAVSATTVRRQTEAVGATVVAAAEAEVARLEQRMPEAGEAPERLVIGADGAMVPLVGGEWAEVKLLSVGMPLPVAAATDPVTDPVTDPPVRVQQQSYFARLADAETFGRQALGERHRRGVERAGTVAAVQDGAPWLQGFVDLHRPDALRILDWPHAAQHLTMLAEELFGPQTARAQRVAERLRRWLWAEGPPRVLAILAGWERDAPDRPGVATAVAYFRDRCAQMDSPAFCAAGWPVGSGATESGHKQVMQARMKRVGMRWARGHVNPLLALSLMEHNGRWATEGLALLAAHCHPGRRRPPRRCPSRRSDAHRPLSATPPTSASPATAPAPAASSPFRHPWRRYGAPLSPKI